GARARAAERGVHVNADLAGPRLTDDAPLSRGAAAIVERQIRSGALSARGLHRVHRLSRTIADLDGAGEVIGEPHVREALLLRGQRHLLTGRGPR
ncbi:MAG TPA: hypothetical protein VII19_04155, partial [Acidimicrobiales bacterium]